MHGRIAGLSQFGYGFIAADGGQNFFFHRSSLLAASERSFDMLRVGDRVEFTPDLHAPRGPRASDVRVTG